MREYCDILYHWKIRPIKIAITWSIRKAISRIITSSSSWRKREFLVEITITACFRSGKKNPSMLGKIAIVVCF